MLKTADHHAHRLSELHDMLLVDEFYDDGGIDKEAKLRDWLLGAALAFSPAVSNVAQHSGHGAQVARTGAASLVTHAAPRATRRFSRVTQLRFAKRRGSPLRKTRGASPLASKTTSPSASKTTSPSSRSDMVQGSSGSDFSPLYGGGSLLGAGLIGSALYGSGHAGYAAGKLPRRARKRIKRRR